MKKYTIVNAFSLLNRVLLIEGDIVYAELIRQMYHIYSPKTRKCLGTISSEKFLNFVDLTDH